MARFNSTRDIGKFTLLSTQMTAQSLTGAFHELTDMQLNCDGGSVVHLLCAWRSAELDTVLTDSEHRVDFGGLRYFFSSGRKDGELCTVTSYVLDNDIAAARAALIAEDQLLFQHALTVAEGETSNGTLGEVLKRVELVLLQRVFLTSRYSPQTVAAAMRAFTKRHSELSAAQIAAVESFVDQDLSFACEHNESFASSAPKIILDLLKQVSLLRVLYLNSLGTGNESTNAFVNVFLEICSEFLQSCDWQCKLLEVGGAGSMGAMAVAAASNKLLIAQRRGEVSLMNLNAAAVAPTAGGSDGVASQLLTKVAEVLKSNRMFMLMETSLQQMQQGDKQSVLKLLDEVAALASTENLSGVTALLSGPELGEVSEDLLKQLLQHCTECNELRFTGLEEWDAFTRDGKIQNLADAIVNALHIYLQRTKLVSVLLTLLLKNGRGHLSESCFVSIRDSYLPKVGRLFFYCCVFLTCCV